MGKKRPAHEQLPLFFSRFFGDSLDGGYVELRVFPNGRGKLEAREFVRDAVAFSDFVSAFDGKDSALAVYFGPAVRGRKAGTKDAVSHTRVCWAEVDCDKIGWDSIEAAKVIHALPYEVQPSVCIHSGHGLHLYWYLERAAENYDAVEGVNKLLRDTVSGDNVWNIDRIMRVPWTWNTKFKPVQSRVLWNYHWHTFTLRELHDNVAEFDSVLDAVNDKLAFIPRQTWEKIDAERRAENTNPMKAFAVAIADRRKTTNARGLRIWSQCRYGGGPGYVGLDEAITQYTALEYCRLSKPTPEKLEAIVQSTLTRVREVYERDAADERWNWKDEEKEVRDKLMRWVRKWDTIKSSAR